MIEENKEVTRRKKGSKCKRWKFVQCRGNDTKEYKKMGKKIR